MKFHLDYTPKKSSFLIDHSKRILLTGSCFSENIGDKLNEYKFETLVNPDGILFNPSSIANSLQNIILNQKEFDPFIIQRDGRFYSFLHHSYFSEQKREDLLSRIKIQTEVSNQFLKNADYLIITLGTAYVYKHKSLNKTVANCHKQPQQVFDKKLLKVEQIVSNYCRLIEHLQLFNPELRIVFTVSPVKHLRDGVEENALSKSVLLLSVHELVAKFSNCSYFPSYELVTDDLRDYRFYKKDMAHPNDLAVEYVWNKFSETFFSNDTRVLNEKILKLNTALNHKVSVSSDEGKKLEDFISRQKKLILDDNPAIKL